MWWDPQASKSCRRISFFEMVNDFPIDSDHPICRNFNVALAVCHACPFIFQKLPEVSGKCNPDEYKMYSFHIFNFFIIELLLLTSLKFFSKFT